MTTTVKGNKVTISFEIGEGSPSSSGKSMVVASTRGNQSLQSLTGGKAGEYGEIMIGLNAYKRV